MSFWKKLFGRKKKVEAFTVEPNVEELKVKKDVEGLIMALGYRKESVKMDDVLVRSYAAMTLGKIRNERAVEPLIKALKLRLSCEYTVRYARPTCFATSHICCAVLCNWSQKIGGVGYGNI